MTATHRCLTTAGCEGVGNTRKDVSAACLYDFEVSLWRRLVCLSPVFGILEALSFCRPSHLQYLDRQAKLTFVIFRVILRQYPLSGMA